MNVDRCRWTGGDDTHCADDFTVFNHTHGYVSLSLGRGNNCRVPFLILYAEMICKIIIGDGMERYSEDKKSENETYRPARLANRAAIRYKRIA